MLELKKTLKILCIQKRRKKIRGKRVAKKHNRSKKSLSESENLSKEKWKAPVKKPNKNEKKKMLGIALQCLVVTCMQNHVYKFKGNRILQLSGGSTGLDLTNELADLYMVWWDTEFQSLLELVNIHLHLYTRFKDDVGLIADDLPFGSIFLDKKVMIDENLKRKQIEQIACNKLDA